MERIPAEYIARAARLYPCNVEAARALGCARETFGRLCAKYSIESPAQRRKRLRREWYEAHEEAAA